MCVTCRRCGESPEAAPPDGSSMWVCGCGALTIQVTQLTSFEADQKRMALLREKGAN